MATKAICIVNGMRPQKPRPNCLETSIGPAPLIIAPAATITSATETKMKESGNHFSAQAVNPSARRAMKPCSAPSLVGVPGLRLTVLIVLPRSGIAEGHHSHRHGQWDGQRCNGDPGSTE